MLGWDVGYVWPLLEGVVVTQTQRPTDSWQLVMGNPHEAAQRSTTESGGETSANPPVSTDASVTIPQVEPPPYESVAIQGGLPPSGGGDNSRNFTSAPAGETRRSRPGFTPRTRINVSSQRLRPAKWPHKASSVFACLCCVIGIGNVSRFSVLVDFYKGCFIFQFLFLSLLIGIPFLYLQMVLGQYLGAGVLNMWYISPAFRGMGVALLYLYIVLGIYSAVPLSWMFIYFKDSFITLKDSYSWGKCHFNFGRSACLQALNSSAFDFYGYTVPSYFHGRVLGRKPDDFSLGELKFEVALYLCIVWIIVFVCLRGGYKTFGKVVYVFGMLPIMLLLMVTMRMGQTWGDGISYMMSVGWRATLLDPMAWLLAAREAFVTWGLLSAVALTICSHNKVTTNITKNLIVIVIISKIVLISAAFLYACLVMVPRKRNLDLTLSSFEMESTSQALVTSDSPSVSTVELTVNSQFLGVGIAPRDKSLSGYQPLRLATEAFPVALAVEGVRSISSFWSICFYTAMILFGLGQQVVIWYCVVESFISINYQVLKRWHTTICFVSCNMAFLLGLPLTSNVGIFILHYLDFSLSPIWWMVLMYFIMLFATLFIRGRPYSTDQLVNVITRNSSRRAKLLPFLNLMWNIVLPLSFLLLTISIMRTSPFDPASPMGRLIRNYWYWSPWARSISYLFHISPVVVILVLASMQAHAIFRAKPDKTFIEKLKLLCCPLVPLPPLNASASLSSSSFNQGGSSNGGFTDDPPPKYTPPPSYSTATSRMIAKQLEKQREQERSNSTCSVEFESDTTSNTGSTTRIFQQSQLHRQENQNGVP